MIAYHNPHVQVTVIDRDQKRIDAWKSRHLPIHEPGLSDIVRVARDGQRSEHSGLTRQPNLFFSTACADTIAGADVILISVNTPTKRRGQGAGRATDLTAFEGATRDIAAHAKDGCILVEKSTVPCKTGQLIKDIVRIRDGIML
jgi:UDPglucose 6-dehydrogenase